MEKLEAELEEYKKGGMALTPFRGRTQSYNKGKLFSLSLLGCLWHAQKALRVLSPLWDLLFDF